MAGNMGAKAVKHAVVEAHEPGGVSLEVNGTPAPTKGTTSVELAGGAEGATTPKPEVLEPWAESKAWHRLEMLPLPPQKSLGEPGSLPREAPLVGMCRHVQPLQESLSEGKRGPQWAPQETPRVGMLALQRVHWLS